MRIRQFVQKRRRLSSSSNSTTDCESPKASSFFASRPFGFKRKSSSQELLANKKSVSFAPLVNVVHVQSYKDESSKDDLWYSQDDIQSMKKDNHLLVNLFKRGYFFESNTHTFLGLEQYLFLNEARYRRDCLYNAVLGLQDRWKERSHPSDAERIAKVYRRVLRRSVVAE